MACRSNRIAALLDRATVCHRLGVACLQRARFLRLNSRRELANTFDAAAARHFNHRDTHLRAARALAPRKPR